MPGFGSSSVRSTYFGQQVHRDESPREVRSTRAPRDASPGVADILKIGEEKRRKEEEKRLAQLFRNKMSSPTRGRRRPSLVDLRRPGDVSMPTGWTPPSKGHGKAAW